MSRPPLPDLAQAAEAGCRLGRAQDFCSGCGAAAKEAAEPRTRARSGAGGWAQRHVLGSCPHPTGRGVGGGLQTRRGKSTSSWVKARHRCVRLLPVQLPAPRRGSGHHENLRQSADWAGTPRSGWPMRTGGQRLLQKHLACSKGGICSLAV